jgi:hypothetical protein
MAKKQKGSGRTAGSTEPITRNDVGLILTVLGGVLIVIGLNAPIVVGGFLAVVGYKLWKS